MATTTGTHNWYDSWKLLHTQGVIPPHTDDFVVLLTTSTHTPDSATHDYLDDITNEVSGNGYARQTIAGEALSEVGPNGKVKWDFDDPVFTANGGSIVAHHWHLFSNTNGTDATRELVAWGYLNWNGGTPLDVTTTDGNTLTINVNASGFATFG